MNLLSHVVMLPKTKEKMSFCISLFIMLIRPNPKYTGEVILSIRFCIEILRI